jgi:molybdate transport system regulatory protein
LIRGWKKAVAMSAKSRTWNRDWKVGLRVWIESAGRAILGKGRLELLEGIERFHSISEAARQMGMSYRRPGCWFKALTKRPANP